MANYEKDAKRLLDSDITNANKGATIFKDHRLPRIKASDITDNCSISYDVGLRLKCGDFVSPDTLLDSVWVKLKGGSYVLHCPICQIKIDLEEIRDIGRPTELEYQFIETALGNNYFLAQDVKKCLRCHSLCERVDKSYNKVQCINCTRKMSKPIWFCWYCLLDWNNTENQYDYNDCGNSNCKEAKLHYLLNAPKKIFTSMNGKKFTVPSIRACPKCSSLIEHKDLCPEMFCVKCKHTFCFICLKQKDRESGNCTSVSHTTTEYTIDCDVAPIQNEIV